MLLCKLFTIFILFLFQHLHRCSEMGEEATYMCFSEIQVCLIAFKNHLQLGCPNVANAYCLDISLKTSPLELISQRSVFLMEYFISKFKYSDPVYLFASKQYNTFFWLRSGAEVKTLQTNNISLCGDTLSLYKSKVTCEPFKQYVIVCELACEDQWTTSFRQVLSNFPIWGANTLEKCKSMCLGTFNCKGVTFNSMDPNEPCFYFRKVVYETLPEIGKVSYILKEDVDEFCGEKIDKTLPQIFGSCPAAIPFRTLRGFIIAFQYLITSNFIMIIVYFFYKYKILLVLSRCIKEKALNIFIKICEHDEEDDDDF